MQKKNATGSKRGIKFDALSESTSGINKNREINEDNKYIDNERNIFVIADGLGGHGNGSEASRITVQTVAYRLTKLYERLKEKDYPPEKIQAGIKGVIEYTNSQIVYPIAEFSKDGIRRTLNKLIDSTVMIRVAYACRQTVTNSNVANQTLHGNH